MISRQDLERLAKLKSEHGILSSYVHLDPRLRFVRQQAEVQFKGALKAAQRRLQDGRWREALERESSNVLNFLSGREPSGRGLAIFSCQPEGLWEVLTLDIAVPNLVDIDTTTKTGILARGVEQAPHFLVAVLQRDKARIYLAEQGSSEEQAALTSNVPGQHKQGGRSQMRFQRHIDFHFAEHRKKVADEIADLTEGGPSLLALGGTDEVIEEMIKTLPESTARMVIGKFSVDHKHDSEQQILERAQAVWDNREQFEEAKLLDQLCDAAKSGTGGVLGIEPTLDALIEEKVRTLVIPEATAMNGSVCTRCDYFSARNFSTCPLCGGNAENRDVTDRAVEKAILTGAEIEVISAGEARDRLSDEGGLGALLRY